MITYFHPFPHFVLVLRHFELFFAKRDFLVNAIFQDLQGLFEYCYCGKYEI